MKKLKKTYSKFKKSRLSWLYANLKIIKMCIIDINDIDVPWGREEKEFLRILVDKYDSHIREIEEDFMKEIRAYISE